MNKQELLEKLELVGRALATDNLVPIFQCFAFSGKTVTAFNDQIAITAPCKTKEAFAVNGKVLLGLLQNTNAKDVDFSIEDDLVITADDSTFKLPWFPKTDFLFIEPDTKKTGKGTLSYELMDGISDCLMTAAKDAAQAAFCGVFLSHQGGTPTLYSTDGDAITRITISNGGIQTPGTMLPNSFCEALTKLFSAVGKETGGSGGSLELAEDWAVATLNTGYTVYGRLLELDNALDHEAEIKKTLKGKITYVPVPDGLIAALSRARVLSDAESVPTHLTIKDSTLTLRTKNQMGVVTDQLPFEHRDVTANVSAELMQRCTGMGHEMAIFDNVCVFRQEEKLFILTSNMGE